MSASSMLQTAIRIMARIPVTQVHLNTATGTLSSIEPVYPLSQDSQ